MNQTEQQLLALSFLVFEVKLEIDLDEFQAFKPMNQLNQLCLDLNIDLGRLVKLT